MIKSKCLKKLQWILLFIILSGVSTADAKKSNCSQINLFIGTSGDNGQVDPGAAVPFGMVRVCPDSNPRSHAGYDYSENLISGISVNRLSGVGCSGAGGNLSIKPSLPEFELRINKQSESAIPGYYKTSLNNGVTAELTATNNIAVEKYVFPKGSEEIVTLNLASSFEKAIEDYHKVVSPREVEGYILSANVCGRGQYKLFYHLKTNRNFTVKRDVEREMVLVFGKSDSKPIEFRVAVSSVSINAARNENLLKSKSSFAQLKKTARGLWDEKLRKVTVEGGSSENRTIFYTSLYRIYLSPANVTTSDGQYLATDGKIKDAASSAYYSSWSLWDTFRTKFPLLALLQPKEMSDMSQSLVRLYQSGKVNWSTDSEATPTVRTEHAVILLLDAYRKGIKGIDFRLCYPQMCKEASELPFKSPDQKLESAYDLWALAQIADCIGEQKDAGNYRRQSEVLFGTTWKKEFMNIDTTYARMHNNGLYQGTRWQYRWAAPQYLDRMAEWSGGKDSLINQLDRFFEQHLYNQGNEPDIHVPFLFNRLGDPQKTQRIVHSLLNEKMIHKYGGNSEFPTPYVGRAYKDTPEGFMPEMDEDDGTMGAWYIFSSIGLYPLIVGEPVYEITSPLFDRIQIKLDIGNTFKIITKNRSNALAPVKEILLNGNNYSSRQLSHDSILNGGTLEFMY